MSSIVTSEGKNRLASLHLLLGEVQKFVHPSSQEHGDNHARDVACVGLWLARLVEEADPMLVFLFALLHDSMGVSDSDDPLHGKRAAHLARAFNGVFYTLEQDILERFCYALQWHCFEPGFTSQDPTTAVCWDADRLLYARGSAEIEVEERYLSLPQSRQSRKRPPDFNLSWQELFETASVLLQSRMQQESRERVEHRGVKEDSHAVSYARQASFALRYQIKDLP